MSKTLVIAEKPSVGRDISKILPGPFTKGEGFLEAPEHVITWAVGHLVQLAEPDEYDDRFKKWRMADLPIVPERFKLVIRDERSKKQMNVIKRLIGRDDIDSVVNACDAGREGELIFAYLYEKTGSKKPVQRLWLNSMTSTAIRDAFGELRPGADLAQLEAAARSRSEADWIVGMNATRAATIRLRSAFDGAVSLGRVQTPTLAILAKRGGREGVPGRDRRDHQAREVRAEAAPAAALRPHPAAERRQLALRLHAATDAGRGAAPLRGTHRDHLSADQLAVSAERHGRRDQADRPARG
jgi:DNA topoisomerase-3